MPCSPPSNAPAPFWERSRSGSNLRKRAFAIPPQGRESVSSCAGHIPTWQPPRPIRIAHRKRQRRNGSPSIRFDGKSQTCAGLFQEVDKYFHRTDRYRISDPDKGEQESSESAEIPFSDDERSTPPTNQNPHSRHEERCPHLPRSDFAKLFPILPIFLFCRRDFYARKTLRSYHHRLFSDYSMVSQQIQVDYHQNLR